MSGFSDELAVSLGLSVAGDGGAAARGGGSLRAVSTSSGYSGTPLPAKLGIRPGHAVAMVGAPPGFGRLLGDLPGTDLSDGLPRPACWT